VYDDPIRTDDPDTLRKWWTMRRAEKGKVPRDADETDPWFRTEGRRRSDPPYAFTEPVGPSGLKLTAADVAELGRRREKFRRGRNRA
jgi:hypothetical protein